MAKIQINLQDFFLSQVKREKVGVIVYLVNGVQLKGTIRGFDNFTLFLENEGKIQLVYKHAITTVAPMKPLKVDISDAFKEIEEVKEEVNPSIV